MRRRPGLPDIRQIIPERGDNLTIRPQHVLALVALVILATGVPAARPAQQRDTLELSGPWTYNGEKLTFTIRLVRVT